jgi:hypothetical protein
MSPIPLEEAYLRWLYSLVASLRMRNPAHTYWGVLTRMHRTEFVWIVPNDDNRVEDGIELRNEFLHAKKTSEVDPLWMAQGCSFLEMMIALARRLSFIDEGTEKGWFWHLMENLGLDKRNDNSKTSLDEVSVILDRVIWRTYNRNGNGGLFPMSRSDKDQRRVELWYQMAEYLDEADGR